MTFENLLRNTKYTFLRGNLKDETGTIAFDSRRVAENSVFCCISGGTADGHCFIRQAYDNGAKFFVCERETDEVMTLPGASAVIVEDARKALAEMADVYYGSPSFALTVIGITGTKGKTSVSYLIRSMLEAAGFKSGIIGTTGVHYGDVSHNLDNTTPESVDIQKYLREMADAGVTHVVMEVSSLGLSLDRVHMVDFNIGMFTNLSNDHIGGIEHKTFEEYRQSKAKLFTMCECAVFNADDDNYAFMCDSSAAKRNFTFGITGTDCDLHASNLKYIHTGKTLGMSFDTCCEDVNESYTVSLPGEFSVYNALCVVSVAKLLNISKQAIDSAFESPFIKGRMEACDGTDGYDIYIDYAHNAMSLEALLRTVRRYDKGRVVCLFGCGGNRPRLRRFEMGEVAGRCADFTVITTDNPRFEKPGDIIADIVTGMEKTQGKYVTIESRVEALHYVVDHALSGDIILVVGKGHEMYQEIEGVKHYFNERKIIEDYLKQKKS